MNMPIFIKDKNNVLAIVIKSEFNEDGIHFCTPNDYSQQLAYMHHPAGKIITPHIHNEVNRSVRFTQEVLVIKKGRLRVDFFSNSKEYIKSYILNRGDVILLASGGHGFKALEELEMYEIKQGPFAGDDDKTKFEYTIDTPVFFE